MLVVFRLPASNDAQGNMEALRPSTTHVGHAGLGQLYYKIKKNIVSAGRVVQ